MTGLTSSTGPAAPPYRHGPYTWDQVLTFSAAVTFSATATFTGDLVFGDAATDSLTVTGDFAQTYTGTDDAHLVTGSGDLTAGKDLARFISTGSLSSTSNVVAIEQTTGAGVSGSYGLYINCTGANVEALKVDAGAVVFDETLTVTGVSTLTGKVNFGLNGGAASASGLLMGVGTTANPATSSTPNDLFAEFRCQSSATSGDNRLLYMRYELTGAAGGGECLRAFSKISAAVGTARGAHISLDVNTTGSVTGLGVGVDAQILVPDQALGGGTYGVINSEIYSGGSSSSVAASDIAFFRAVAGGDATGAGTVDTGAHLFSIQGLSEGTGNLFSAGADVAAAATLKILVGSTEYFILLGAGESN